MINVIALATYCMVMMLAPHAMTAVNAPTKGTTDSMQRTNQPCIKRRGAGATHSLPAPWRILHRYKPHTEARHVCITFTATNHTHTHTRAHGWHRNTTRYGEDRGWHTSPTPQSEHTTARIVIIHTSHIHKVFQRELFQSSRRQGEGGTGSEGAGEGRKGAREGVHGEWHMRLPTTRTYIRYITRALVAFLSVQ